MTQNGGWYQEIQGKGMEIIQVTTKVPCLKQSSGMVSSHVYKQYKENDKQW